MGYLISTHLLGGLPDFAALRAALPNSLEPHIYKHSEHPVWAVDTLRSPLRHKYYFGISTETHEVPDELPDHLAEVQTLYDELSKRKSASALKRSFLNVAELVSRSSGLDVLSIYTDDDGADLAIRTHQGRVQSIEGSSEESTISFKSGQGTSFDPIPEDRERRLHENAARAFEDVFLIPASEIGFGLWDSPENYGFVEVGTQSDPVPRSPKPTPPEIKPKKGFSLRRLFGDRS